MSIVPACAARYSRAISPRTPLKVSRLPIFLPEGGSPTVFCFSPKVLALPHCLAPPLFVAAGHVEIAVGLHWPGYRVAVPIALVSHLMLNGLALNPVGIATGNLAAIG